MPSSVIHTQPAEHGYASELAGLGQMLRRSPQDPLTAHWPQEAAWEATPGRQGPLLAPHMAYSVVFNKDLLN